MTSQRYIIIFNKPQGFGCAMVGEDAYRVVYNSLITIPGELDHPYAMAPEYAMYFCQMIRHLESNPWNDRIMEEDHKWLLESKAEIWPEKEQTKIKIPLTVFVGLLSCEH